MQILACRQTNHAGDERSSRNPVVRERARKQHIANAAEWKRRAIASFSENAPKGIDYDALVNAHRRECKLANISPVI